MGETILVRTVCSLGGAAVAAAIVCLGLLGCRNGPFVEPVRPDDSTVGLMANCPERSSGHRVDVHSRGFRLVERDGWVLAEWEVRAEDSFVALGGPAGVYFHYSLPDGSIGEQPRLQGVAEEGPQSVRLESGAKLAVKMWATRESFEELPNGLRVRVFSGGLMSFDGPPAAGRYRVELFFSTLRSRVGCDSRGEPLDAYDVEVFSGEVEVLPDGGLGGWTASSTGD